jgi:hypothetical protein
MLMIKKMEVLSGLLGWKISIQNTYEDKYNTLNSLKVSLQSQS